MNHPLLALLDKISSISIVLPLILCFTELKNYRVQLLPIVWLLCFTTVINLLHFLSSLSFANRCLFSDIRGLIEVLLLSIYFLRLFEEAFVKRLILCFAIILMLFSISHALHLNGIGHVNALAIVGKSLFVIALSLLYFSKISQEMKIIAIERFPLFWVNSALLIYFSGNLFLFLFTHSAEQLPSRTLAESLLIQTVVGFIYNLLLATGLWYSRAK